MVPAHKDANAMINMWRAQTADGQRAWRGQNVGHNIVPTWRGSYYAYEYLGKKNFDELRLSLQTTQVLKDYQFHEMRNVPHFMLMSPAQLMLLLQEAAQDKGCPITELAANGYDLADIFGDVSDFSTCLQNLTEDAGGEALATATALLS